MSNIPNIVVNMRRKTDTIAFHWRQIPDAKSRGYLFDHAVEMRGGRRLPFEIVEGLCRWCEQTIGPRAISAGVAWAPENGRWDYRRYGPSFCFRDKGDLAMFLLTFVTLADVQP